MMLTPNELAIARSVIYASLFDYPLALEQLHLTLIESSETPAEILATYRASERLPRVVEYRDGFFFPIGRRDLVGERRRRESLSRQFLDRHRRLLAALCAVPYTRMIALSGSIAHMNLDEAGDLDLFIITRGHHVWSVTVAVVVIAKLFRRRDVTCANFVIADSHLTLEQQDLFTANQAIHLKPLVGRDVLEEFVAANPFVLRHYPNFRPTDAGASGSVESRALTRVKRAMEWALQLPAIPAEAICRVAYRWHLRRRAGSWRSPGQVRLGRDYLKLHTQSHRESVSARFESAIADALEAIDRRQRGTTETPVRASRVR
jgi:hypothetical protein